MKLFIALLAILLSVNTVYAQGNRTRSHQFKQWVTEGDIQAEIEFGREVSAKILGVYTLYKNDALTRYLNLLSRQMSQYANRPEISYTVGILDTASVNAFAAPGGYIFITKGAIDAMENESELAGVIAHEMMHINHRHIVKELDIKGSEKSAVAGLGRIVGGATDALKMAFFQAVDRAVKILLERGYQKKDEIEADTSATMLIASMNYDPKALIKYFNRIKGSGGNELDSIKKLHPPFDERIRWIEDAIRQNGITEVNFIDGRARFDEYTKKD